MMHAKDIYQRFVDFEERAAAIYLRLASRFSPDDPELSSLWLEMGMHEKQHAELLQFCIAEEMFVTELPTEKDIGAAQALFAAAMKRAADPDLSVQEAFQIATQIEGSEVNAIYDRLTTPTHASAYLLRRKIATTLPDHVGQLLREAPKFKVPEETLKELKRLAPKTQSSS
jgi:hypothetical protein